MLKIFGVFLTGIEDSGAPRLGIIHTPLAFFSRANTADKYITKRLINYPHEQLKIEIWSLDDQLILDDLYNEPSTDIPR